MGLIEATVDEARARREELIAQVAEYDFVIEKLEPLCKSDAVSVKDTTPSTSRPTGRPQAGAPTLQTEILSQLAASKRKTMSYVELQEALGGSKNIGRACEALKKKGLVTLTRRKNKGHAHLVEGRAIKA